MYLIYFFLNLEDFNSDVLSLCSKSCWKERMSTQQIYEHGRTMCHKIARKTSRMGSVV